MFGKNVFSLISIVVIVIAVFYLIYQKANNYSLYDIQLTYWLIANLIFAFLFYLARDYIKYRKSNK